MQCIHSPIQPRRSPPTRPELSSPTPATDLHSSHHRARVGVLVAEHVVVRVTLRRDRVVVRRWRWVLRHRRVRRHRRAPVPVPVARRRRRIPLAAVAMVGVVVVAHWHAHATHVVGVAAHWQAASRLAMRAAAAAARLYAGDTHVGKAHRHATSRLAVRTGANHMGVAHI